MNYAATEQPSQKHPSLLQPKLQQQRSSAQHDKEDDFSPDVKLSIHEGESSSSNLQVLRSEKKRQLDDHHTCTDSQGLLEADLPLVLGGKMRPPQNVVVTYVLSDARALICIDRSLLCPINYLQRYMTALPTPDSLSREQSSIGTSKRNFNKVSRIFTCGKDLSLGKGANQSVIT